MYNQFFRRYEEALAEFQESESGQVIPIDQSAKYLVALDLGSNSFHLIIAQEDQGRLQILDRHKETVRLAEGLTKNKNLTKTVTDRALQCLSRFAQRFERIEVENIRVVGTSTFRHASNSKSFLDQAAKILGEPIEVISGREEARLIYLGVRNSVEDAKRPCLVVDIGGGSTEIIFAENSKPKVLQSLPIGCVALSHNFFADGSVLKKQMDRAINQALMAIETTKSQFLGHQWEVCIGASGTVTATSKVAKTLNLLEINLSTLNQIKEKLFHSSAQNGQFYLPSISADRKFVFPGGLAILIAFFEAFEIDRMVVTDGALREGLLHDLIGRS